MDSQLDINHKKLLKKISEKIEMNKNDLEANSAQIIYFNLAQNLI